MDTVRGLPKSMDHVYIEKLCMDFTFWVQGSPGIVAQQIRPLPATPASIWAQVCDLVAPFPNQQSAHAPEKATESGPGTWVPTAQMRDLKEVPGSFLQAGPVLGIVTMRGSEPLFL